MGFSPLKVVFNKVITKVEIKATIVKISLLDSIINFIFNLLFFKAILKIMRVIKLDIVPKIMINATSSKKVSFVKIVVDPADLINTVSVIQNVIKLLAIIKRKPDKTVNRAFLLPNFT
ncbi:hypothetical protein JZO81_00800 [Enterococcus hulanensis]|uniref:hypothetical protein n=1 Tax=Enterococcus hulanensis TaxID=2559929 RepID=UPI001A90DD04|nr:hypothetical protein [Enterococcus hulanensis]MBO0409571.1 hypothetical protein [Enterococcus hulanensis]